MAVQSKLSRQNTKSIVKTKTYEGVEAFRQIATTSLHLQNEDYSKQPTSSSLVVPTINEPEDVKEGEVIGDIVLIPLLLCHFEMTVSIVCFSFSLFGSLL